MSRVPPELARRLDRLARRAHAFHRFAHHPLCDAYAPEVLRLGRRTRVCRGCAAAVAGALAGALAALSLPPPPERTLILALIASAATAGLAALGRRPGHRRGKLLTRAVPAGLSAAVAVLALRCGGAAGAAVAAGTGGLLVATHAAYRRRGPDRSACLSCPERALPRACSGFRAIVRREAAFGRIAGRLIQRARGP